jgi:eukaryotic-like serine/threonine-protein kinase
VIFSRRAVDSDASRTMVGPVLAASGSMLTPNLRLLSLLGKGGMGSVWLAEHLVLGTEVAVKLLSPELAGDPEALSRFRREATAIAQLKSPHVVRIHDVGSSEGTPFFVMERLEGEDLSHRLERVGRLPLGVVTAVVVQMCKALSRVHELGVVHRDLKPGNVFLTDVDGDLVVKLVDFGIAKQRTTDAFDATSDSALLGTPSYMSPEQVLSTKDVTFASDLYSLGVVVYECLAGDTPFSGETLGALHVAIAQGRYVPISSVDRALPKSLDAWFARALSPNPAARFASAQQMAETFLVAARGTTPFEAIVPEAREPAWDAPPASIGETQRAWLRMLPVLVGGLAVVALLFGIVLGVRSGKKNASASASSTASAGTGTTEAPMSIEPRREEGDSTLTDAGGPALRVAKPAALVPPASTAPAPPAALAPAAAAGPSPTPRPKKDRGF